MTIIIGWYDDHLVLWWSSYDDIIIILYNDGQQWSHEGKKWQKVFSLLIFSLSLLELLQSALVFSPSCPGLHKRWVGRQAFHLPAPLHLSARGKLACSPALVAAPGPLCKSSSWQCYTPPLFWRQALSLSLSYSAHVALVDIFLLILEMPTCTVGKGCNSNYKPVWEDLCIFSSVV